MLTVALFGHSKLEETEAIKVRLYAILNEIVEHAEDGVEFLCGGYGQFDRLAADGVEKIKVVYKNKKLKKTLVVPYNTEQYKQRFDGCRYDELVYPPLEGVPPEYAIARRNLWMVDRADCLVFYVVYSFGGAAAVLRYARRRKKKIFMVNG